MPAELDDTEGLAQQAVDPEKIASILGKAESLPAQDREIKALFRMAKPKPQDGTEGNTLVSNFSQNERKEPTEAEQGLDATHESHLLNGD